MKSSTTTIWFVLAAMLFAFIFVFEKYFQHTAPAPTFLLRDLRVAAVTHIQISPAGAREISAGRTNGGWQLEKPFAYPATATGIENLLGALAKLIPAMRLTASDMPGKNSDAAFGFDNPQYTLDVTAGDQDWHLRVGNKTPPGDQVYIRIVGLDGAFVTDASWLQQLPHSANDWRDKALINTTIVPDSIIITNGTKVIELQRNATNHLWRMTRPLQARADETRLAAALQQLQAGRVTQFVTDDPRADLSSYGLQPTELDVWLGRGSNFTTAVHAGKNLPNQSALVYARREGWNSVVAANKDAFAAWRGAVNDFRDTHLLAPTAPIAEIEVRGDDNFTLQQRGANNWAIAGEKFSADPENVLNFFKLLLNLRVSEFVKDVVTPSDLQGFGLATPSRQIILRSVAGDTNSVVAQLLFGAAETNRVFVKRGDEDFIYALTPADYARLPEAGWEFRDRRIWNFSETNVAQITLRQSGKTRTLIRTADNKWSLAAGSQGIINPPAIEESVHRLGELTAAGWVGHQVTEPEKYGLNTNNLAITVELKSGEKLNVDFGAELTRSQTALASVNFADGRWVFVFPPVLYQFVATYLTIPPDAP